LAQNREQLQDARKSYGRVTEQEYKAITAKPAATKKVSSNQNMRNKYGRINAQEYKALTKRPPQKLASK